MDQPEKENQKNELHCKNSYSSVNKEIEMNMFTPREYQVEILEIAKEKNTIACLGTGTGKTFIAVMLIRHFAYQTLGDYDKEAKRTVFLVPTVPLVHQQADVIRKHTDLNVGEYFGDKNMEINKDRWTKELIENNILVLVAEVFKLIIHHGLMPLRKINLIVIDECHRAVKKHPYAEVLKCFDVCDPVDQPRVFGLTAPLINGKCKPHQLNNKIKKLEIIMHSSVAIPDDIMTLKECGTNPLESIYRYEFYRCSNEKYKKLIIDLYKCVGNYKFLDYNIDDDSIDENIVFFTQPRKCVSNINKVFTELGPWCGLSATKIMYSEIKKIKQTEFNESALSELEKLLSYIYEQCSEMMGENHVENLFLCCPPQLLKLLEILEENKENYRTTSNNSEENSLKQHSQFSGIIFVKQRIYAYTICEWLKEISKHVSKYSFIKINYIVGHGFQQKMHFSNSTSMTYKKQQALIKDFRNKKYNFLIATSVIEEGLDIPKCNLVIRFDLPEDFRAYIQSKGRARATKARYILMTSHNDEAKLIEDLKDFQNIEKFLLELYHQRIQITENIAQFIDDDILPPFMPLKKDGAPRITMTSAISLINRYCTTLPCDRISKLTPNWKIKQHSNLGYICHLSLPINSPLKETIMSPVMESKRLAKMAAALKTCEKLYKIGELDENLLPIGDNVDKYIHELIDDDDKFKKIGTNKSNFYKKWVPEILQECLPKPSVPCFLYAIHMDFSSENNMEELKNAEKIEKEMTGIGILTTKPFPPLLEFPVFTAKSALQININIELIKSSLEFTNDQLHTIQIFHQYIFNEIIQISNNRIQFNPELSEFSIYIVPIIKDETNICGIDWNLINLVDCHLNTEEQELLERSKNGIKPELYNDAIIYRQYNNKSERKQFFYVEKILFDKNPLSCFPLSKYDNYIQYYYEKYNIKIKNTDQFLLYCGFIHNSFCTTIKSRYLSQYGKSHNRKWIKKQKKHSTINLIPELCIILPIPCSLFKKILTLPSILYRLSSFIQAEQFRLTVAKETGIGLADLPSDFKWPNFEFCYSYLENSVKLFSEGKIRLGKSEVSKINLDEQINLKSHSGPSPGKLLTALTLCRAHDGINLERLETLGDSFLKYAVTIYLYCAYENLDEGKLTNLKSILIRNSYLFHLAKSKDLEKYIIAQQFNFKKNWLPPCYVANKKNSSEEESKLKITQYIEQRLSDKSIADSVEALIGVYLLNCGPYGAIKFMSWLGLDLFNNITLNSNKLSIKLGDYNWLTYTLPSININIKNISTLELFEHKINYTFKNKIYLLEALTHPSFSENCEDNLKYGCYQRLEFLGDAILDYMVTRYLYTDPRNHSPGTLTILRSALVNNNFFATLAVKNNYHKYLQHKSLSLHQLIDKFASKVIENDNVQYCCYDIEEYEVDDDSEIEIPKPLADMFESVAGAIYVDSGMSLETVWDVYYPMMKPGFDICDKVPNPPVKQLFELYPQNTKFLKAEKTENELTQVKVIVNGEFEFTGCGPNKIVAKKAAAKKALKALTKKN